MEGIDYARSTPAEESTTSSIYSADTPANPEPSHSNENPRSHKRQSSSIPSYMNAPILRKPLPGRNITPGTNGDSAAPKTKPSTPPPIPKGVLLVAIAAKPHPSTIPYLHSMLKKTLCKEINILGSVENEEQLKQLKIDVYALLGKLGREMTVQMDLRSSWAEAEISTTMLRVVANGDEISGVLCCPSYDSGGPSELDILEVGPAQLELPWKSSVGFLHSVAKGTIPNFLSSGHEHKQPGLFVVTSPTVDSPTSILYSSACRTLMTLLVAANTSKNLTIDYAENVLPPEPEPVKTDGDLIVSAALAPGVERGPAQESPTKLWMNWEQMIEFMPG